jgi:hypothetical protein
LTLSLFAYKVGSEVLVIEQRKSQRFELRLPLELVRAGSVSLGKTGETRNLSSSGILFCAFDLPVSIGDPVEYLITLPVNNSNSEVRIRCVGKIVRQDEGTGAAAATLERYEFVRA